MGKKKVKEYNGRYDWSTGNRGHELINKGGHTVHLMAGGKKTFMEMYKLGYLYGKALDDAERIASKSKKEIKVRKDTKQFSWNPSLKLGDRDVSETDKK